MSLPHNQPNTATPATAGAAAANGATATTATTAITADTGLSTNHWAGHSLWNNNDENGNDGAVDDHNAEVPMESDGSKDVDKSKETESENFTNPIEIPKRVFSKRRPEDLKELSNLRMQLEKTNSAGYHDKKDKKFDDFIAEVDEGGVSHDRLLHMFKEVLQELKSSDENPDRIVSKISVKNAMIAEAACLEIADNTAAINDVRDLAVINNAVGNMLLKKDETLYERIKDMIAKNHIDQENCQTYISVRLVPENNSFLQGKQLMSAEIDKVVDFLNLYILKDENSKITKEELRYAVRRGEKGKGRGPRPLLVEFRSQRRVDEITTIYDATKDAIIKGFNGEERKRLLQKDLPYIIDTKPTKLATDLIAKGRLAQNLANASLPSNHPKVAVFNTSRCTIALFDKRPHQEQSTGENSEAFRKITEMMRKKLINPIAEAWRFLLRSGNATNEVVDDIQSEGGSTWKELGAPIMQRWLADEPTGIYNLDSQGQPITVFRPRGDIDAEALTRPRRTRFPKVFPQRVTVKDADPIRTESSSISLKRSDWFDLNEFKMKPVQNFDQVQSRVFTLNPDKRAREQLSTGDTPPEKEARGETEYAFAASPAPPPVRRQEQVTSIIPSIEVTKVVTNQPASEHGQGQAPAQEKEKEPSTNLTQPVLNQTQLQQKKKSKKIKKGNGRFFVDPNLIIDGPRSGRRQSCPNASLNTHASSGRGSSRKSVNNIAPNKTNESQQNGSTRSEKEGEES